ncbi:MAG: hypothetical protein Q9191_003707 [Dirinaria sp. TL-2023a]
MPPRRVPHPSAIRLTPLRIATQILVLQLGYYAIATALILFTSLSAGKRFSLSLVFSWHSLRGDTTVGWTLGLCWLMSGVFGVLLLLLIVSRSKLVLDFTLTLHLLNLIFTSLYTKSLPRNLLWWLLQFTSAGLMTLGGIWACQWRELRPVKFGGSAAPNKNKASAGAGGQEPENARLGGEDVLESGEGEGYEIGGNRGRGRDGGGLYEMVGMK